MTTGAQHLRMAELSSRSGVAASTIRHYLRLGLLPQPLRTAKTMAYYGPEHLERLRQIRQRLQGGASLHQVGQELAGQEPAGQAHDPGDAADDQPVHSTQRARLIEAGRAIFLHSGFDTVSVEEVVQRAGVGKAAFYRHFAGKRALLIACLESELDWYQATTGRDHPSPHRLLRYPDLFRSRRFHALLSLFALLRQADASRTNHDQAVERARARLRSPLETDLRVGQQAGDADGAALQAEMLLSVAEYVVAYAATSGSRDLAALVRRSWTIALTGHAHA